MATTPYPFGTPGTCLLCSGQKCSQGIHDLYMRIQTRYQEDQVTDRHDFERSRYPESAHQTNSHPDCRICRANKEAQHEAQ